jgi:hypothetical protein
MWSWVRHFWRFLDYAGRGLVAWAILGAFGLAGVVTALGAWLLLTLDVMPTPILVVLSIGTFLLLASAAGIAAPYALRKLPPVEVPASAEKVPTKSLDYAPMPSDDLIERERLIHAILQEVVTTLEYQRAEVQRYVIFNPNYQGAWPEDRGLVAQEPRYADVYRSVERAFQSLGQMPEGAFRLNDDWATSVEEAVAVVDTALAAINDVLGVKD